jgi:hypothetical protein
MNNLGIVVPHLGASQAAYEAIQLANSHDNVVLFFEQLVTPCMPVQSATMCVNELMSFRGTLVTTNIENMRMAHKLVNLNTTRLIFYVWDLEWLRPNKNNYIYNVETYHMPHVLLARHEEHVGPIFNYCNRQPIAKEFQQVIEC